MTRSLAGTIGTVAFVLAGFLSIAPALMSQSAQPAGKADREQITGILDSWEKACNSHDVWKGRTAIEEGHAAVHETVFRNSVQRERLEELTFVGPDAAIVRFYSTLTGDERSPDKVVRSRKILMVTKRNGAWRVGWGQNTRLADTTPN